MAARRFIAVRPPPICREGASARHVPNRYNDEAPILLRNNVGAHNHWLGVKLIGRKCNTDAVGARISWQAGDLKRSRMKVGGGSFLSAHDPRVVLGIGNRMKIDSLEVKWPLPSGAIERFTDVPLDRYITIVEGTGKWK